MELWDHLLGSVISFWPLLIEAAEKSGLEEPFVHIIEIGNYSITYRISGLSYFRPAG